ncbi:MAG: hypothetical protein GX167_07540 [Firmicutes bacterium]|jgi:hypothetical protein|nr:hypothetical protein [Bacillota bacterium]
MKADRILIGLLVVLAGTAWLLSNLGLLSLASLWELRSYWPVLIVIWGILILFGKGGSFSGCLLALVILVLVFGVATAYFLPVKQETGEFYVTQIENRYGAQQLRLILRHSAGDLLLHSYPGMQLAYLQLQSSQRPEIKQALDNKTAVVTIADRDRTVLRGRSTSRWEIGIGAGLPVEIFLETGATDAEIDMSGLAVTSLEIKAGAADLDLILGRTGGKISIESGAGSITVQIPDDVGVRLRTAGALLSVKTEDSQVISVGKHQYESKDLEKKTAVVDLEIKAGAGSVTLQRR